MSSWLRAPLLHFALLGGVLFWLDGTWRPAPSAARRPLVIPAARVEELRADFTRATGLPATPDDDRALVAREVDEELLYREALVRGLDRDDRSIRWQLAEKMRFLTGDGQEGDDDVLSARARDLGFDQGDPVIRRMLIEKVRLLEKAAAAAAPVDDRELEAYLAAHAGQYHQPEHVTFAHVFFARRAGRDAEEEARRLLVRLRAGAVAAVQAAAFGDGFPLSSELRARSERQLATVFGADFAAAVLAAPPGEWVGPVASAHGVHLVRVEAVEAGGEVTLAAVRPQVLAAVRRERARTRLTALVARLRRDTPVQVEWPGEGS